MSPSLRLRAALAPATRAGGWRAVLGALLVLLSAASAGAVPPEDRLALSALLRAEAFGELARRLQAVSEATDRSRASDDGVEHAYLAFANSAPELAAKLDAWLASEPGSYHARLARGIYFWNLGVLARGTSARPAKRAAADAAARDYFARATLELVAAVRTKPELSVAYGLLINIATELGEEADAQRLTRLGLQASPRSFVIRRRFLASLEPWARAGDSGTAFARLDAFVDTFRDELRERAWLRVLQGYPEFVRADLLARNGKREQASAFYDRALSFGDYWVYRYRRGANHLRLGHLDAALEDFDAALRLRPQAPHVLSSRARALRALGRDDEAHRDWSLALSLNPYDPLVLLEQAYALRADGRTTEAIANLDKALHLGAGNEYVWEARGRMYLYDLRNFERAALDLKRATELNPGSRKYWFNYALALYEGHRCGAVTPLQRYLSLCEPGDCPAQGVQWVSSTLLELSADPRCVH